MSDYEPMPTAPMTGKFAEPLANRSDSTLKPWEFSHYEQNFIPKHSDICRWRTCLDWIPLIDFSSIFFYQYKYFRPHCRRCAHCFICLRGIITRHRIIFGTMVGVLLGAGLSLADHCFRMHGHSRHVVFFPCQRREFGIEKRVRAFDRRRTFRTDFLEQF